MRALRRVRKSPPKPRHSDAARQSEVGYGKPPRAHQFKSGQSGNPRGRPKGTKNESTILNALLNRKIEIREGGRVRRVTVLEAMLLRFTEDSLKGDTKSAAFLLNRYNATTSGEPPNEANSSDDKSLIDAFAQRLLQAQREEQS